MMLNPLNVTHKNHDGDEGTRFQSIRDLPLETDELILYCFQCNDNKNIHDRVIPALFPCAKDPLA